MQPTTRIRTDRDSRARHDSRHRPERPCACSGIRWCARCRDPLLRHRLGLDPPVRLPAFLEAPGEALDGAAAPDFVHRFDLETQSVPGCPAFAGVRVLRDFVSRDEEAALLAEITRMPMARAQSGKWKQHFGPRFNFNKRKMNAARFRGLPAYARALEGTLRRRLATDAKRSPGVQAALSRALAEYRTTDAFVLRYRRGEASNLDFHVDDVHAYGELILGLSLESDSVLTFLEGRQATEPGRADGDLSVECAREAEAEARPGPCVRVPLPARSMLLLYGPARWRWRHGILARDVRGQRTSITLRTLATSLRGCAAGRHVMALAKL